jgi:histidyl-tRNA synthetase
MSKIEENTKISRPIARQVRGFIDNRADFLNARSALIARVLETYKIWGFEELETGAMEFADCLGKFLPDDDRPNEGVFALQDDDEQWLSLRYDLTAPLARFVAQNYDAIPKPFRRAACGPVWRNEKPGPGRYREFWQCDADIVGSPLPQADAEVIAMLASGLESAGIARGDYIVNVSNRKLLDGLLFEIGVDNNDIGKRLTVLRALDKWDKFGETGVSALLGEGRRDESGDFTKGAGLSTNQIEKVIAFAQVWETGGFDAFNSARANIFANEIGIQGHQEIMAVFETLSAMGFENDRVAFNTSIVRGLEYYTGTVFEAEFLRQTIDEKGNKVRFGSIGSGGRYDDLVMRFRGERVPATGCSIGVSRLLAALECAQSGAAKSDGPVLILVLDKDKIANYFQMANELRNAGIKSEVYLGTAGMKAQMKYADRKNAPLVILEGSNERAQGIVTIKDLKLGAKLASEITDNEEWRKNNQAQFTINRTDLISEIKARL